MLLLLTRIIPEDIPEQHLMHSADPIGGLIGDGDRQMLLEGP